MSTPLTQEIPVLADKLAYVKAELALFMRRVIEDRKADMPPIGRLYRRVTWADRRPFDAELFPGLECHIIPDKLERGGLIYNGYRFYYPDGFSFYPHHHEYAELVELSNLDENNQPVYGGMMRFLVEGEVAELRRPGQRVYIAHHMLHDFVVLGGNASANVYFPSADIDIIPNGA